MNAPFPPLTAVDAALVSAVVDPTGDVEARHDLASLAVEVGTSVTLLESVARAGFLLPHHIDPDGVARYSDADAEAVRAALILLDAGLPLAEFLALAGPTGAAVQDIAERAVDAFIRYVRDPALAIGDNGAIAERLVEAHERMLPAVEALVAHHLRRRLIVAALGRLTPADIDD